MGLFDDMKNLIKQNLTEHKDNIKNSITNGFKTNNIKGNTPNTFYTNNIKKNVSNFVPINITMPGEMYGCPAAYRYDEVDVCIIRGTKINFSLLSPGDIVYFQKEPENKYDSDAVIVYTDKVRIGYLYRGIIQDMVNDYLSISDQYLCSKISHVHYANETVKIAVYFYKEDRSRAIAESIKRDYKEMIKPIEMGFALHKSGDELFVLNENEIKFTNELFKAIKSVGINYPVRLSYRSNSMISYLFIDNYTSQRQIGRIKLRGKSMRIQVITQRTTIWHENITIDDAIRFIPKWVEYAMYLAFDL